MRKEVLMTIFLASLVFLLSGCEASGEAYIREQEAYQLQSAKICCAVKNLRGEYVYTPAENDAVCVELRGVVTNCPRVCCNVNGKIFGEYSYNFCLIREGTPVQCPALRW